MRTLNTKTKSRGQAYSTTSIKLGTHSKLPIVPKQKRTFISFFKKLYRHLQPNIFLNTNIVVYQMLVLKTRSVNKRGKVPGPPLWCAKAQYCMYFITKKQQSTPPPFGSRPANNIFGLVRWKRNRWDLMLLRSEELLWSSTCIRRILWFPKTKIFFASSSQYHHLH